MFDGNFRAEAERKLQPVGQQLKRTGITADHITLLGVAISVGAAVAIGAGALRAGLALLILTALPDLLDGAVAKASGTASKRGAFFDSVADRFTDAMLLGGVAWYLSTTPARPHRRAARSPCSAPRCSSPTSGPRRSPSASTPRAASWSGPSG